MQRSSETIGAIAAALAKAQAELTNPEKSLVATIRGRDPREGERTFRYAPLSSGLDIVRKCLGQHEIAAVQTTEIDREAGLIRLTTMLAHSSGEWMASDWPVCPLTDAGSPQRMGAALTYARRYSLFALVGITGEDDLDAPDLPGVRAGGAAGVAANGGAANRFNGASTGTPDGGAMLRRPLRPTLAAEESARLRDGLLAEIASIALVDDMAAWAHRKLPAKNTLTTADAVAVEQAFQAKLTMFSDEAPQSIVPTSVSEDQQTVESPAQEEVGRISRPKDGASRSRRPRCEAGQGAARDQVPAENARTPAIGPAVGQLPLHDSAAEQTRIDKGALALPEPRRHRDRGHLRFVATQPCLLCGRRPSDPHHLRFAQAAALGRRVSDEFTVPLCRTHHRALHARGDEAAWWAQTEIDPVVVARELWQRTRAEGLSPTHDEHGKPPQGFQTDLGGADFATNPTGPGGR